MMPKIDLARKYKQYLYDYYIDNQFDWPCISCRWGPEVSRYKDYMTQKIYFACRTDSTFNDVTNSWSRHPSYVVVAEIDIPYTGRVFNEDLIKTVMQLNFKKCPHIRVKQLIVNPGDPTVIKKCNLDSKWISTKSDSQNVFIWDLDKHKHNPSVKDATFNHAEIPDITFKLSFRLIGHSDSTTFALDWAKTSLRIASGGRDKNLLIWDLEDYQSRLSSVYLTNNKREMNAINSGKSFLKVSSKEKLVGHENSVEDLSFHPKEKNLLVSCGVDKKIIFWDLRVERGIANEVLDIHTDDINCIDWNILDENFVASGSHDSTISIIDVRMMKASLKLSMGVNSPVNTISFSGFNKDILGVGTNTFKIFDLVHEFIQKKEDFEIPMFNHYSIKGSIADFDWNQEDPWSILLTCQDNEHEFLGGGNLFVLRPNELLRIDQEEALRKLERHQRAVE